MWVFTVGIGIFANFVIIMVMKTKRTYRLFDFLIMAFAGFGDGVETISKRIFYIKRNLIKNCIIYRDAVLLHDKSAYCKET